MTTKTTTPIPSGITTPDSLEAHLGTLKFLDGLPDASGSGDVFDNLATTHMTR
jgi:hypothetical protein